MVSRARAGRLNILEPLPSADCVLRCEKCFRFDWRLVFADLRGTKWSLCCNVPGQTPWSLRVVRYVLLGTCLLMPNHQSRPWIPSSRAAHGCDLNRRPPPSLLIMKPLEKRDIRMCKLKKNDSSRRPLAVYFYRCFFYYYSKISKAFLNY